MMSALMPVPTYFIYFNIILKSTTDLCIYNVYNIMSMTMISDNETFDH